MEAERYAEPRERLITAILEFLADQDLLTIADIKVALDREIDVASPDAVLALKERLTADFGWAYYPPDPLARRIHHLLADRFLAPGSALVGAEHLASMDDVPLAIMANHLSYADGNLIEVLLHRSGHAALADRLTAVLGCQRCGEKPRECHRQSGYRHGCSLTVGSTMQPRECAIHAGASFWVDIERRKVEMERLNTPA